MHIPSVSLRQCGARAARGLLACLFALLSAAPALAALPPQYLARARMEAVHHLQLTVSKVEMNVEGPGTCTVEGVAAQVFRGGFTPGDPVRFTVRCLTGTAQPMPGPDLWFHPQSLREAKAIEGFFNGTGPAIGAARDQLAVVPGVRERPFCDPEGLSCDLP